MTDKSQIKTLFLDTIQSGGTFIFLSDGAPEDLKEWLGSLSPDPVSAQVPFVVRRKEDFLSTKVSTRLEDLVVVFSSQRDSLDALTSRLQGQVLLLGAEDKVRDLGLVDYTWSSCTLVAWSNLWADIYKEWMQVPPLGDFKESHQSACLFLDRDDVIVKNVPYNKDPQKVELMPGIVDLIHRAHSLSYWVAMVSNQSGLGRGWIAWSEYQQVHQKALELLAKQGAWLDECVWSAYIDKEAVPQGRLGASLRKPRSGMFHWVDMKLKVSREKSVMVGDSATDLIAAYFAGVRQCYLLSSEKVTKEEEILSQFQSQHFDFAYKTVAGFDLIQL